MTAAAAQVATAEAVGVVEGWAVMAAEGAEALEEIPSTREIQSHLASPQFLDSAILSDSNSCVWNPSHS